MITKLLDFFNELGYKDFIYLTTQTWSYKAINMYLGFGFKPYFGPKPQNWVCEDSEFERENIMAWNIIFNKINNYRNCELLTPLKELHPGLKNNLELIDKHGINKWSGKRGKRKELFMDLK